MEFVNVIVKNDSIDVTAYLIIITKLLTLLSGSQVCLGWFSMWTQTNGISCWDANDDADAGDNGGFTLSKIAAGAQ